MRNILLHFTLILMFSVNIFAQDFTPNKEYEIGGIKVTGPKFLDESILISLSGLNVGDKVAIPSEKLQSAIKNLWAQGLFENIKIEAEKVIEDVIFLDLVLTERPRLSKYKFIGLRKPEEDELRGSLNLMRGRVLTENVKMTSKNAIKNYFLKKGFLAVDVEMIEKIDKAKENRIILDIKVRKGEKVKIKEIVIKGNEIEADRIIRKKLKKTKQISKIKFGKPKEIVKQIASQTFADNLGNLNMKGFYEFLDEKIDVRIFSPSKFTKEDFETDKNAILAYYNTKGFRDAKILRDTIYLLNDKMAKVEIDINEGKKYYFRDIDFEGSTKFNDQQLARFLKITKGEIYNQGRLDEALFMSQNNTDISSLYMDDGYLFFNVVPTEKTIEGDSIDMVIKINEGPQATIKNIIITGNKKTNENVIRREIRTYPGNKFSRSDIIRTQRELAGLGYFDAEQIGINPIPNQQDGTVDIEYSVVERPSDQFELSAGWGGQGLVGSLGLTFNNFSLREMFKNWDPIPSGDGQKLSIRFQSTGQFYQSLNASFTEPWLGGKSPTSLSLSGFFTRLVDSSTGGTFQQRGGSIGLGKRLKVPDDFFTIRTDLSYQYYNLDNYRFDFIVDDGIFNNLSLNTTISRYSVGINPYYPTEGSNFTLEAKITPPYSLFNKNKVNESYVDFHRWTEYHKWKFKAEWFTRIKGDLVLRASGKMGFIGNYSKLNTAKSSTEQYSPFERFELGDDGLQNFNLFGKDVIALRGYEIISTAGAGGDPFYGKFTTELRYPISLNPTSTIYTLAFLEAGNSWVNFNDWNAFKLRRSAGLGLRFFLPMFGTIGFDYGIGFDKTEAQVGGPPTNFWDYLGKFGKFSVILGVEPE